jgi:hypothetical protein
MVVAVVKEAVGLLTGNASGTRTVAGINVVAEVVTRGDVFAKDVSSANFCAALILLV